MKIREIGERIGNQPVEKVVIVTLLLVFIGFIIYIKVLGSVTEVGINIEKKGYCKSFGDEWFYDGVKDLCSDRNGEQKTFTLEEFREACPKNKLFSTQFYSDCWNKA